MLWLALHHPCLLTEQQLFLLASERDQPAVTIDKVKGCDRIIESNTKAQGFRIHPGMKLASAQLLCANLHLFRYREDKHQSALQNLAIWAMQFTSWVTIYNSHTILLEIKGSLRLFGGSKALLDNVIFQAKSQLNYTVYAAVSPTPSSAYWLAKAIPGSIIESEQWIEKKLSSLPVDVMTLDEKVIQTLHQVGITTLSQLIALPKDSIIRRFGNELIAQLDNALIPEKEVPEAYQPPIKYEQNIALNYLAESVQALCFIIKRMLQTLIAFLSIRLEGVLSFSIHLSHEGTKKTTDIHWKLSQASNDEKHLLRVINERMNQLTLTAPVSGVSLKAEKFQQTTPQQIELFSNANDEVMSKAALVDFLRARLGHEAVYYFQPNADFRPEYAVKKSLTITNKSSTTSGSTTIRPTYLLKKPQALGDNLPLQYTLWQGPERIETGWWDGHDVCRDYYLAHDLHHRLLWLYQDRKTTHWFLHGLFA